MKFAGGGVTLCQLSSESGKRLSELESLNAKPGTMGCAMLIFSYSCLNTALLLVA